MASLLETLSVGLRDGARSAEILGDTIAFSRSGGVATNVLGIVQYDEEMAGGGNAAVVTQSISVEIDMEFCAARPAGSDRLSFPNIALLSAHVFRPVNVRRNEIGDAWLFGVERVNG